MRVDGPDATLSRAHCESSPERALGFQPSDKSIGGRSGVWAVFQRLIPRGERIWIADTHRDDGKRFVIHLFCSSRMKS